MGGALLGLSDDINTTVRNAQLALVIWVVKLKHCADDTFNGK